jgi:anti-anti-sigma factor
VSTAFQITTTPLPVVEANTRQATSLSVPPRIRIVVALAGELDLATRDVAYQACVRDQHIDVVVDLGGLTFLDCAGYGALMSARRVLLQRGGSLTLRNQTGLPARLLTLIHAISSD